MSVCLYVGMSVYMLCIYLDLFVASCVCVCVCLSVWAYAPHSKADSTASASALARQPPCRCSPHTLLTRSPAICSPTHTHTHTQTRHTPITHRALCAPRRRRGAVPGTRYPLRATRFPNDFCFCFSFFFQLFNQFMCLSVPHCMCVCVCIYCVYRFSIFTLPLPFFIFNFYLFACFFSAFYSPLFLSFFLFLSHSVVVVVVFFFLINRFRSRRGHKSGILLILF